MDGEFWIGLHNREITNCSEVHHFWEDGCQPLGWSKWGEGSPNNCENDRCVVMKDTRWHTANCSDEYSFICEKEIDCQYSDNNYNITLEDVSVTELVYKEMTSISVCEELCKGMAKGDTQGCTTFPDNDTCVLIFIDSGDRDYPLSESYTGTAYSFKSCEQAAFGPAPNNSNYEENELPDTTCPRLINSDFYYEYLDAYRVALLPSLYKTLDIVLEEERV
ncbi:uncharacterized protein LOC117314619 [Pecten maximus]|uniref:uncharacterized protein LOC117314619 n=1 Tax=Pecten maximus TaxID=6579 RepID=UPI0014587E3A|nr:uncharacterized protein LOC117314619 [Pecten maximus]